MRKRALRQALLALLALVAASVASAQTTGTVIGVITDAQSGKPIPGAFIWATSPSLQGEQTAVTDATGAFSLPQLPPGPYRIAVEAGDQYTPAERTDVVVRLDKTIRANLSLIPAAVVLEEQVVRTGIAPVINLGSAETGTVISKEFMSSVPVGRDFQSSAVVSPGAQKDVFGVGFAGAGSPENNYILDGMDVTDPTYGTLGSQLLDNFVQEVDVKTGSFMPEYGRATGGIINVVTKSGSNELHGSVFGNLTPGFLSPDGTPFGRLGEAIALRTTPSKGSYQTDFGGEVGGPIAKDRLWFYLGFAPVLSRSVQERFLRVNEIDPATGQPVLDSSGLIVQHRLTGPNSAKLYDNDVRTYQVTGKLTYLFNENNNLTVSLYNAPTNTKFLAASNAFESYGLNEFDTSSTDLIARYAGKALEKRLIFELQGGWHRQSLDDRPKTIDGIDQSTTSAIRWRGTNANPLDLGLFEDVPDACTTFTVGTTTATPCPVRRYFTGGYGFVESYTSNRFSGRAAVSGLFEAAGHHNLKLGVDIERNDYDNTKYYSGNSEWDYFTNIGNGSPGFLMTRGYATVPGGATTDVNFQPQFYRAGTSSLTNSRAYFAQDSWSILDLLTLNGGIRWETQDMVDRKSATSPHLTINDNIGPRVQAIYDFTGTGRGKISASWGRFYEAIPLDMGDRSFGSEVLLSTLTACSPPSGSPSSAPIQPLLCPVVPASQNGGFVTDAAGHPATFSTIGGVSPVAPDLKGQFVDQYGGQVEYEVMSDLSAGVEYQGRRLGRVIEDMSSNDGATVFIANPSESKPWTYNGQEQNPRQVSTRDPVTGRTYIATFPAPQREYDGVTFKITKNFSRRWLAQASYTYSSFRGNYPGLFRSENSTLDPNITSEYDLPSLMPNKFGPLPADRPHQVKLFGAYVFPVSPRLNVSAGGAFTATSGSPVNALGAHPLYGPGEAFIVPRGSAGRTPFVTDVDLRAGFEYVINPPYAVKLTVDVLNVFNSQTATAVDENYTFDAVQPMIGAQCKNKDSVGKADPIAAVQADCPDLKYLKTIDGRAVTPNGNWGKPYPGPSPLHGSSMAAFQAPISVRFGLSMSF